MFNINKIKNILILGMLGVIAFWIGLYAFRTQKPATPVPKISNAKNDPGHVGMQEINFVQVKDGVKLWELKAETVEYQQPQNLVSFKKVVLTYFPKGEKPISLVGNLGSMDTETKNIMMEGEVVISTPEGYELKVPSLYYRDDKQEISTEGTVNLQGPAIALSGEGMVMNLESQKVKVYKKVRMTLYHSFLKS